MGTQDYAKRLMVATIASSHYHRRQGATEASQPWMASKRFCRQGSGQRRRLRLRGWNRHIFKPLEIDPEALIVALEQGDFTDTLKPIQKALHHLLVAKPVFQVLIARARA